MEPLPLILISISAIFHSYWNFLIKKIIDKSKSKLVVYWLCLIMSCLIFLPVFIYFINSNPISLNLLIYPIILGFFLALYIFFALNIPSHGSRLSSHFLKGSILVFLFIRFSPIASKILNVPTFLHILSCRLRTTTRRFQVKPMRVSPLKHTDPSISH